MLNSSRQELHFWQLNSPFPTKIPLKQIKSGKYKRSKKDKKNCTLRLAIIFIFFVFWMCPQVAIKVAFRNGFATNSARLFFIWVAFAFIPFACIGVVWVVCKKIVIISNSFFFCSLIFPNPPSSSFNYLQFIFPYHSHVDFFHYL